MSQHGIPFMLMRGGSSRGPYFLRSNLPEDRDELAKVLIGVIGSGHPLNIDGIGGGNAVTTKVAMLSPSMEPDCDVDYFFAQVSVMEQVVDFKPTCGNIMTGVGPAAIEMGLIKATGDKTLVRIHAVNTGAKVDAIVCTQDGMVVYDGEYAIDGVPGAHAPVVLKFKDVAGSSTGAFLPTGNVRDKIDGVEVTCMDVAMPMVIARAEDFELTGYESAEALNENKAFFEHMESVRVEAGKLMGMGDVSRSVTPKFAILSPAKDGGSINARYFMPWKTHPTMAVTGAQCLASCAIAKGSIADGLWMRPETSPANIVIEHPMGSIEVLLEWSVDGTLEVLSAGLTRTARKLASGEVFVSQNIWDTKQ